VAGVTPPGRPGRPPLARSRPGPGPRGTVTDVTQASRHTDSQFRRAESRAGQPQAGPASDLEARALGTPSPASGPGPGASATVTARPGLGHGPPAAERDYESNSFRARGRGRPGWLRAAGFGTQD
jgi:hypothetical protein